jgi:hypothetical protein
MEPRKMTDDKFKDTDKEALQRVQRTKPTWTVVHGFVGDGNLAVDISKTDDARPRFSIKFGKRSPEGHLMPFVPMYADGIKVRSVLPIITDLFAKAEDWIGEQIAEARVAWDLAQAERGKPETRHTGKTQRNRDKHRHPKE